MENQRLADLGDGRYVNPILGGDYPDPSVVRVGRDYYMTHSSFEYVPGLLIWHSRDLVNWEPVCNALNEYVGDVYAPELIVHEGVFYIYFPAAGTNWVVTAPSPEGPWSKPVDLKVGGIDPGHVVGPDGTRYLHLSGGNMVQLSEDGLSVVGKVRHVYDGWRYPDDWCVEGFCLESPKLTLRGGFYYLTSAEGGTAGPATSHMVVSARSKTPWGPWENSPYNPIVRTRSRTERWWSRGHATLVDTPGGKWWLMYHAYENGYRTLGRQTLLEPIEWTDDGWFVPRKGVRVDLPIEKPEGESVEPGLPLSDDFSGDRLGLQWRFYKEADLSRASVGGGKLTLRAEGSSPADCSPLVCIPVNHAYEARVTVSLVGEAEGGLILFYSPACYCGVGLGDGRLFVMRWARKTCVGAPYDGRTVHLRLVNDHHDVSFFYSTDGRTWTKMEKSVETSAYNHNAFGGFVSLRLGVYAAGEGEVVFRDFRYRGLD